MSQPSERSPLLNREEPSQEVEITTVNGNGKLPHKITSLLTMQMFIIMFIQLAEPITASVIFPFVVQVVRDTGVTGGDESKVGYYAGFIESVFFAAEALTVLHWGRASDRLGRKPILLIGSVGLAVSIMCFGLSHDFWLLVTSRFVQGVFNGNIGVTKAVMSEITDQSNVAQAFGLIPMMWAVGVTLGPVIGGVLSHPADTWPSTFGRVPFFRYYPYILPCAVAALLPISAFVLTLIFFKETLPSVVEKQKYANRKHSGSILDINGQIEDQSDMSENVTDQPPPLSALFTPRVLIPIFCYIFLAFVSQCCDILIPLVFATSIPYGGLGLDSFTIGVILACLGIVCGLVSAILFPILLAKFGVWKFYMFSYSSYFVVLACFPSMNAVARRVGHVNGYVWAILVLQLFTYPACFMVFGCIFVYFNDSAPTKATLGAVNGMAQMASSAVRTFAPLTASSLFALSQQHNILGGTFIYWVMSVIALAGWLAACWLPRQLRSATE